MISAPLAGRCNPTRGIQPVVTRAKTIFFLLYPIRGCTFYHFSSMDQCTTSIRLEFHTEYIGLIFFGGEGGYPLFISGYFPPTGWRASYRQAGVRRVGSAMPLLLHNRARALLLNRRAFSFGYIREICVTLFKKSSPFKTYCHSPLCSINTISNACLDLDWFPKDDVRNRLTVKVYCSISSSYTRHFLFFFCCLRKTD